VRLVPVGARPTSSDRKALLDEVRVTGPVAAVSGAKAARSQDFLYGDDGLPG
jgi:hypothetical protein